MYLRSVNLIREKHQLISKDTFFVICFVSALVNIISTIPKKKQIWFVNPKYKYEALTFNLNNQDLTPKPNLIFLIATNEFSVGNKGQDSQSFLMQIHLIFVTLGLEIRVFLRLLYSFETDKLMLTTVKSAQFCNFFPFRFSINFVESNDVTTYVCRFD